MTITLNSFIFFSIILTCTSCKEKVDSERTNAILKEYALANQDPTILDSHPQISKELLVNGGLIPTKFPESLGDNEEVRIFYEAWHAVKDGNLSFPLIKALEKNYIHERTNQQLSYLALEQKLNSEINPLSLKKLLDLNFRELSIYEQCTYLNLLITTSSIFANHYDFQNTLSTIFYGLQLIETSRDHDIFIHYQNQLLEIYVKTLMNESDQFTSNIPKAIDLLKNNYSLLQKEDMNLFFQTLYLDENNITSTEVKELTIPVYRKQTILTHLGFLQFGIDPQKAIDLFDQALKVSDKVDYGQKNLHIYNAYCYLDLQDHKQVQAELELARDYHDLPKHNQTTIDFLITRVELELLVQQKKCNLALLKVIELREAAKKEFSGRKSLHLEDFYSQNTVEFIKLLKDCNSNSDQYSSEIIQLFHESKIYTENNLLGITFSHSKKGNLDLLKVNNFHSFSNLKDPIYKRLFIESTNEYLEHSTVEIPELQLEESLMELDSQVVNFIVHDTEYGVYVNTKDKFDIHLLDRQAIDSLCQLLIDSVRNEEESTVVIDQLRSHLSFIEILESNHEIALMPDGQLSFLPFEIIFPDKQFTYLKTISQLRNEKKYYDKGDGQVFSFTDKKTLRSRSKKRIPELAEAYKECQFIQEITTSNLTSGSSFTKQNFEKYLSTPFIHLATHGESNTNNSLNNYIILRNHDQLDTLYAFEIANSTTFPHVAILSSCSTGTGEFQLGSGTFSIANALRQAGTKDIVKTLWPIDDRTTRQFMEKMYSYWTTGYSLHDSMYKTKQEFRETHSPKDWAGFILEGPGNVFLE